MDRFSFYLFSAAALVVALWIESAKPGALQVTSSPHSRDAASVAVNRFAATGRVQLRRVTLPAARSAEVVVSQLAALVGQDDSGAEARFKQAFCIPPDQRGTISLQFETSDTAIWDSAIRATRCVEALVAAQWLPSEPIRVRILEIGSLRAHATASERSIHLAPGRYNIGTAIHEIAHHIEFSHPEILQASKLFIARRGRGAPVLRLSQLTGNPSYEANEVAVAGNWPERGGLSYSGKFYGDSLREATATEAISTGVERLLREPRQMFRQDPDYFLFLLLRLQVRS